MVGVNDPVPTPLTPEEARVRAIVREELVRFVADPPVLATEPGVPDV